MKFMLGHVEVNLVSGSTVSRFLNWLSECKFVGCEFDCECKCLNMNYIPNFLNFNNICGFALILIYFLQFIFKIV